MNDKWKELYDAAKQVLKPRDVSEIIGAGGVSAAVESVSGKIYVGVCVDTSCTLGICAEPSCKRYPHFFLIRSPCYFHFVL